MKVIFGQGNPEDRYTSTRHNVGWQVLGVASERVETEFKAKPKLHADIAEYTVEGEKVLLVKPTTYYNETGRSLRAIVDFYKLDPSTDILVLHDDLALDFGVLRTRGKGGDAGNNGIKSINSHVGEDYHRLRIGIASEQREIMGDSDFVLARFTRDEQTTLEQKIIPKSLEIINDFVSGAHQITSHNPLTLA